MPYLDPSLFAPKTPLGDSMIEPEFKEPYEKWKQYPSPTTSGVFLKSVDPILRSALVTYTGSQAKSPNLYSKARLLALQSMKNYDPSKAKLKTYLMSQLQGLRRAANKEERILSIPEQVLLDRQHIYEAENRLIEDLGRDPSDRELADFVGLSPKRINYIRQLKPALAEGSFISQSDEGGAEPYAPAVENDGLNAWNEFVYHSLDPVDQQIMEYTLGMHGRSVTSNQDLARRLRLSPGAISQRKAKIQAKLDERFNLNVF